jgi:hypothetical protein
MTKLVMFKLLVTSLLAILEQAKLGALTPKQPE